MAAQATGSSQKSILDPATVNGASVEQAQQHQQPEAQALQELQSSQHSSSERLRTLVTATFKLLQAAADATDIHEDEIVDQLQVKLMELTVGQLKNIASNKPFLNLMNPSLAKALSTKIAEEPKPPQFTKLTSDQERVADVLACRVFYISSDDSSAKQQEIQATAQGILKHMENFLLRGERAPFQYVNDTCGLAGHVPEISNSDLRLYAASLGYRLKGGNDVAIQGDIVKRSGYDTRETLSQEELAAMLHSLASKAKPKTEEKKSS